MKKTFIFLLLLNLSLSSTCQIVISSSEKDSIVRNLNNELSPLEKYNSYVTLAWYYSKNYVDSAYMYLAAARELNIEKDQNVDLSELFRIEGNIYIQFNDYNTALGFYIEGLKTADSLLNRYPDNTQYLRNSANYHGDIGLVYFNLRKFDKALDYYYQMLEKIEKIQSIDTTVEILREKIVLLNNIGSIYLEQRKFDKALEYYKSALEVNLKYKNEEIDAVIYNNIGIIYIEKKEYEFCYHYHQKALDIRKRLGLNHGLVQSYNNLAKYYVLQANLNKAEEYAKLAYDLSKKEAMLKSHTISVEILKEIYSKKQDYKNGYLYSEKYKRLNDSIFNQENFEKIAKLESQYKFEKQKKELEWMHQKEITQRKRKELIYTSIISISILLFVIFGLLFFLTNSRRKRLVLEKKTINLAKDKLEKELEFKNKELTTNVMYLLRKNEFITSVAEKLVDAKLAFKKENQPLVEELIKDLKSNTEDTIWQEFEVRFTQVHSDFYEKLNDQFPNLSPNEKKLCAFLRLNMSTKEISAITYQSGNSITVARSRLRKKMGLDRDENLVNYLVQL